MRYVITCIWKSKPPHLSGVVEKARGWELACNGGRIYWDINQAFRDADTFQKMYTNVEYVVDSIKGDE